MFTLSKRYRNLLYARNNVINYFNFSLTQQYIIILKMRIRRYEKVRKIRVFLFAILFAMLISLPTYAATINVNTALPVMKGWKVLPAVNKTGSSTQARVYLTRLETSGVVFQVRYNNQLTGWSDYVSSINASATGRNFYLPYGMNLGSGTPVQVRLQNFDFTVGAYQVEGYVDIG